MSKERIQRIRKITIVGIIFNLILVIFKFIAGFAGKSSAMIADAAHSLSDFISDIIVLIFVGIASKPIDDKHKYGLGKFEAFATLIVGVILFIAGLAVCYDGIAGIINCLNGAGKEKPQLIALYAAIISIIIKEGLFWYTYLNGKKAESNLVIANAWHHRSDAFSSIATALGISGAIFLGEQWRILDPLAALIVCVFILKIAIKVIVPTFKELLEQSLPDEIIQEITSNVENVEHIHQILSLKTRSLGNNYAIELHVSVSNDMSIEESHKITENIQEILKQKYGKNTNVVVHFEPAT